MAQKESGTGTLKLKVILEGFENSSENVGDDDEAMELESDGHDTDAGGGGREECGRQLRSLPDGVRGAVPGPAALPVRPARRAQRDLLHDQSGGWSVHQTDQVCPPHVLALPTHPAVHVPPELHHQLRHLLHSCLQSGSPHCHSRLG